MPALRCSERCPPAERPPGTGRRPRARGYNSLSLRRPCPQRAPCQDRMSPTNVYPCAPGAVPRPGISAARTTDKRLVVRSLKFRENVMKNLKHSLKIVGMAMTVNFCAISMSEANTINLLVNGNFEADLPGTTMAAGVTGWLYGGNGNPALSFIINDGHSIDNNYLWLNDFPGPMPSAYQDITITPGATYNLSGQYHNRVLNPGANGLGIAFIDINGGFNILETIALGVTPTSASPDNWFSLDITRSFTTSAIRIEFISQFGADADTAIDNLALTQTASPVPIPSALLLFGTGLSGLVSIGRSRRQRGKGAGKSGQAQL